MSFLKGSMPNRTMRKRSKTVAIQYLRRYYFAEDTRTSKKLINHYDIDTKLYSYHDHSSEKEIARLLDILKDIYNNICTNIPKYCFMKPLEAEIVKISLNGYITTKISFTGLSKTLLCKVGIQLVQVKVVNQFTVLLLKMNAIPDLDLFVVVWLQWQMLVKMTMPVSFSLPWDQLRNFRQGLLYKWTEHSADFFERMTTGGGKKASQITPRGWVF